MKMGNKEWCKRVSPRLSAYLYFLHTVNGVPVRRLAKQYPQFSLTTIFRHATKAIQPLVSPNMKRPGRPPKITDRDKRKLVRTLISMRNADGRCTSKAIQVNAGLSAVANRTVRHHLNQLGYKYRQCRRKGVLKKEDLLLRVKFAKMIIKEWTEDVWTQDICFYLDGSSFVHKVNPRDQARAPLARVWRKKNEGLSWSCTSKGKKAGVCGKTVHLIVCISYGKGVIFCEQYEKMNGEFFANFIKRNFKNIISASCNPSGHFFVQDGDPSQNSKLAKQEMSKLDVVLMHIPARSPDLNPIENLFHLMDKKLRIDAITQNITHETYLEFCDRVVETLGQFPICIIDNIIKSMPSRMREIVKRRGQRLRY